MEYNGKHVPDLVAGLIENIKNNGNRISKSDLYRAIYKIRVNKESMEFINSLCHMYTDFDKMKVDEKLKIVVSQLIKDINIDDIGYEDGTVITRKGGIRKRKDNDVKAGNGMESRINNVAIKINDELNDINKIIPSQQDSLQELMITFDEEHFIKSVKNTETYFTYVNADGDYLCIFYIPTAKLIFVTMVSGEVIIHKLKEFFKKKYNSYLHMDLFPYNLYSDIMKSNVINNGGLKYFYIISENKHYFLY